MGDLKQCDHIEGINKDSNYTILLVDRKGNLAGKFDSDKYDNLNEFQLLLYEYSEMYRCKFIKPFNVSIR